MRIARCFFILLCFVAGNARSEFFYLVGTWRIQNSGGNFLITNLDGTTATVAKAAATSQTLTLSNPSLGTNTIVKACRIKSVVAFAGTTTLTATVGITGSNTACIATPYDLKAAVSNANKTTLVLTSPIDNIAATNMTIGLASTGGNISAISTGTFVVSIEALAVN